ncbi:hypothetical protein [Nocardioides pakistanensis]
MSLVALPYGGTSGHSGTSTSKTRARNADRSGKTASRQDETRTRLTAARTDGLTVAEVCAATGWHHGTASGVLSVLHMVGDIARLAQTRNGCKIYVMPRYVGARVVEPQGRKAKPTSASPFARVEDCDVCQGTGTIEYEMDPLQMELGFVCGCGEWVVDTDPHEQCRDKQPQVAA